MNYRSGEESRRPPAPTGAGRRFGRDRPGTRSPARMSQSTHTAVPEPGAPAARDARHPRPAALLGALTLSVLAFSVVQTSIVPILPALAARFAVSTSDVAWLMTANLLAAAVFTPLLGRIGDLRGRKPMLLVSVGGVVLGSLLAALGGSFLTVLLGRVLMGLGGGVLPLSIAI